MTVLPNLNALLVSMILPALGSSSAPGAGSGYPGGAGETALATDAVPALVPEPDVTSLIGGLGALLLLRRRR